ncbi:predicted protein [Heterostelium album PN500]|uniref:Cysteine and histidine-rich domain-containing protein n=1 Tax=Heterostelium pallidum (strain ATCC 26659 / Pp 5 / PN500) TaxID=670386 RepID=D3B1C2_HETP5|nr:predicted protein [Heterostelium album PN500]EFA85096.1 predicted protein [Heterostelium album PN500]|eukprot:XP_020437205.1 predicted protein [Heterostelium album PN500]
MKCGNNGCGKEYTEETVGQCCYHPGSAIFHEGMKGWSCCSKRVVDFDDFLQIPGCSTGQHKEKEEKQPTTSSAKTTTTAAPTNIDSNGREVYGTHDKERFYPKPVTTQPKPQITVKEYIELNDEPNAIIKEGAKCTRNGCTATYVNEQSREETCTYHPGDAVFHEGSKGWACCKPKAALFEEFLKIKGCREGKHKFIPTEVKNENFVECRNDWYQSFDCVHFTIYSKNVNKEKSVVEFVDRNTVSVDLVLPNDKYYKKTFKLANSISTTKSSFSILSTKVEIKLYKDPQDSWSKLEENEVDLYRYQV